MERLLHYVWQNRLFPLVPLHTTDGRTLEVIDTGLHNTDAGPDFFNAKIKLDGILWVGNVEIHQRASDWVRHGHHRDTTYNNVVLHVVEQSDAIACTAAGERPAQVEIAVPDYVWRNFRELQEKAYPPCHRLLPELPTLLLHNWLSVLTAERLEEKTQRIAAYLDATGDDWEAAFFTTLARGFGFGLNAEAFEDWARRISLSQAGHHRDDLFQIEALFLGQAGFLDDFSLPADRRDDYFLRLQSEYDFLRRKFSLTPMEAARWKFLRLRPQNFPHVRLAQLAMLFHRNELNFRKLIETESLDALRTTFAAGVSTYWETHFSFGKKVARLSRKLQRTTADLLLLNVAAPLLFLYGRRFAEPQLCERATTWLEQLPAENDRIVRRWLQAGLTAENAADTQALLQLHTHYCERKDCLRCRIGHHYLKKTI